MINWSALWPDVRDGLESAAAELRADTPTLWSDIRCAKNASFPFWVYASLNVTGPTGDEDVVLSASFKFGDSVLSFTSDIASGDGQILADGPRSESPLTDDERMTEWAATCLEAFSDFIEENLPLVRETLDR